MINELGTGGLKMMILAPLINKSLKITWIKKYLDNNNKGKWNVDLKKHGCQSFLYNLNVRDTLSTITTSDTFLKELLGILAEVNFEPEIISRENFLDQQLWHNSLIKMPHKAVFLKNWLSKGTWVKHLLVPDNTFLSLNDFCCKYEIEACPLSFCRLISAVKSLRSDSNFQDLHNANYMYEYEPPTTKIYKSKKQLHLYIKTD